MSFRDKTKKMRQDLQKRTQESIDRGEDMPEYGTIFIKEKIPEGVGFWKPDTDDHLVDIIPFVAGEQHPRVPEGRMAFNIDVWIHQNIGPMYDQFICPQRMFKKVDPICNYMRGKRLPEAEWKAIAPKRRTVYLVWVHDTPEEEEKGIQIWEVAWWNFEKTVDEIAKSPKGGAPVPFSDYDDGKSIAFSIKKSGTFTDSSGKERDSIDFVGHRFVDRDEKIPDSILDQSFSLDECIIIHPEFSVMEEAFTGQSKPGKDEETAPESQPASEEQLDDPNSTQNEDHMDQRAQEAPEADFECPGGGTPGLDIEKLPECAKCPHYDPCSDLADSAGAPPPEETEKAEPKEPEKKERKRIIRRRR
jgi:hypothetical protein